MSASPSSTMPSTKRPLEDPSSPSAPTDLPEAKRPALDKLVKEDADGDEAATTGTFSDEAPTTTGEHPLPSLITNGAPEAQVVDGAATASTNGASTGPVLPEAHPILSTSQDERAGSQA